MSTINHPTHYNAHPSGIECIDVVEHLPFNPGNAIKYCWRAGHKGNLLEDLKKALWYAEREAERFEKHDVFDRLDLKGIEWMVTKFQDAEPDDFIAAAVGFLFCGAMYGDAWYVGQSVHALRLKIKKEGAS